MHNSIFSRIQNIYEKTKLEGRNSLRHSSRKLAKENVPLGIENENSWKKLRAAIQQHEEPQQIIQIIEHLIINSTRQEVISKLIINKNNSLKRTTKQKIWVHIANFLFPYYIKQESAHLQEQATNFLQSGHYTAAISMLECMLIRHEYAFNVLADYTRVLIKKGDYTNATAIGKTLRRTHPTRREGYRFCAEAMAKSGNDLSTAFLISQTAYNKKIMSEKMHCTHVHQIFSTAMRIADKKNAQIAVKELLQFNDFSNLCTITLKAPALLDKNIAHNDLRTSVFGVLFDSANDRQSENLAHIINNHYKDEISKFVTPKLLSEVNTHIAKDILTNNFNILYETIKLTAAKGQKKETRIQLQSISLENIPSDFAVWEHLLSLFLEYRILNKIGPLLDTHAAAHLPLEDILQYRIQFAEKLAAAAQYDTAITQYLLYLKNHPTDNNKWQRTGIWAACITHDLDSRKQLDRICNALSQSDNCYILFMSFILDAYAKKRAIHALAVTPERLSAIDFLSCARRKHPKNQSVASKLFSIYLGQHDYDACETLLETIRKESDFEQLYWISKSRLEVIQQNYSTAVASATKAVEVTPTAAAYRQLALTYLMLTNYPLAIKNLTLARSLAPKDKNIAREIQNIIFEITAGNAYPVQSTNNLSTIFSFALADEKKQNLGLVRACNTAHPDSWILFSINPIDSEFFNILTIKEKPDAPFVYGIDKTMAADIQNPLPVNASWIMIKSETLIRITENHDNSTSLFTIVTKIISTLRGCYIYHDTEEITPPSIELLANPKENTSFATHTDTVKILYSPAAVHLLGNAERTIDSKNYCAQHDELCIITEDDFITYPLLQLSAGRYSICLTPEFMHKMHSDPNRCDETTSAWLHAAHSIIVTCVDVEEFIEDTFNISTNAYENFTAGIKSAIAFAKRPVCIAIGAGIGNQLFAAPLIRAVSIYLNAPIDVVIHSPVDSAHHLFGQSPYINMAYKVGENRTVKYEEAFITSSFGAIPFGYDARRKISQRPRYDFYATTKKMNEAAYNFLGIDLLFPGMHIPKDLSEQMFIRNFTPATQKLSRARTVIGMCCPQKEDAWSIRQWPYFAVLVDRLSAQEHDLRSFGLPHEAIKGTQDCTSTVLRYSIKEMAACDIFITSDGGIFHIADALGLQTVALFGPTSAIKNGPVNNTTRIIHTGQQCSPCQFTQEFQTCKAPSCLHNIDTDLVISEIEKIMQAEQQTPMHDVPSISKKLPQWNNIFEDMYLAQSFSPIKPIVNDWHVFFDTAFIEGRLQRAEQLLQWRTSCGDTSERFFLRKAKYFLRVKNYDSCFHLAMRMRNSGQQSLEWERIALENLYRLNKPHGAISLWNNSKYVQYHPEYSAQKWTTAIWQVIRSQLKLNLFTQARANLVKLLEVTPSFRPALIAARHFDETVYTTPDQRASIVDPERPSLYVLRQEDTLPDYLRRIRDHFEIYIFDTVEKIPTPIQRFRILSQGKISRLTHDPFTNSVTFVREKDSLQWTPYEYVSGEIYPTPLIDEDIRTVPFSYQWKKTKPRVVICAHHHLEKENPRGGERSTLYIVRQLIACGYEVLVVVENKKSDAIYCEQIDDIKYVVAGRYAYEKNVNAIIEAWLPDVGILYGETSLRAFGPFVTHQIPYIMFPRDWQEITSPAPYSNLLNRAPVTSPSNPYKRLYHHAADVVTNAAFVADVIYHLYGVTATTSYVPVAPPLRAVTHTPEGPIVLINPRKMQGGDLVRALAEILPHRQFKVIGEDGRAFPTNVTIEPFFNGPYEDMYDGASVVLFPLIGSEPCGTGRVVFEALHCGVPVISTNTGGMPEILPDAWLLTEEEPEKWREIIENIQKEEDITTKCAHLIAKFDCTKEVEKILSLLSFVTSSSKKEAEK